MPRISPPRGDGTAAPPRLTEYNIDTESMSHPKRSSRIMKKFVVLLFLFSIAAFAQVTPPLPETKTPPLPDKPVPQTAPVTPPSTAKADYSQEPYIIKDFRSTAKFENDGTGTKTFEAVVQIQT